MSYLDPPGTPGGQITWTVGQSPGVPKNKSVTYDKLKFSYDYTQRILIISDAEGDEAEGMALDMAELSELRAAMTFFGLTAISGGGGGGGGGVGQITWTVGHQRRWRRRWWRR